MPGEEAAAIATRIWLVGSFGNRRRLEACKLPLSWQCCCDWSHSRSARAIQSLALQPQCHLFTVFVCARVHVHVHVYIRLRVRVRVRVHVRACVYIRRHH